jgi:hypothetical protein
MAEEKTVNPQLAYLNISSYASFQKEFTSFTNVIDNFASQVDASYLHHLTKVTNDPVESEIKHFSNLNSSGDNAEIYLANFSPEFVLFWIDKYHTAHHAVKAGLNALLGDNNIFFRPFNESMGHLKHIDFIKDRSTQSLVDTDSAILDIPCQYAGVTDKILDIQTQTVTQYLSKLTNAVFKQNIKSLGEPQNMESDGTTKQQQTVGSSANSHGVNLAVDKEHYKRMKGVTADIVKIIQEDLKELKDAFVFMETHTSNQTVLAQTIIQKKIEDLEIKTDFIGHKIIDTNSKTTAARSRTVDILSVDGYTQPLSSDA